MPPPVVYRDLFVEHPYAAVLDEEYLETRCSTCFKEDAKVVCDRDRGCEMIRYCDDECRKKDRAIHEYECEALKMWIFGNNPFARLLTRVLTRRRLIDEGEADLTVGLEKDIQNRYLDRLWSHQDKFESDKRRRFKHMTALLAKFQQAYRGTRLMSDLDMFKRLYCVISVNSFAVSGAFDIENGARGIGLGLYLNASRFDHSCRPDLGWHFDGAKMVISYPSTAQGDDAVAKERLKMTRTEEKLDKLTVCYGFGAYLTSFPRPPRHQRRESLAYGYFFKCQCSMCSDEDEAELELHAAAFECRVEECREPYVWREVPCRESPLTRRPQFTIKCQPSCECPDIDSLEEKSNLEKYERDADAAKNMKKLESKWEMVTKIVRHESADGIIKLCEPVWQMAAPLWHGAANLRMHLLQELLFKAYYAKRDIASRIELIRIGALGIDTRRWYEDRYFTEKTCDSWIRAPYAIRLANLLKMKLALPWPSRDYEQDPMPSSARALHFEKTRANAAKWYRYAAKIWRAYGKYALGFSERLEEMAQEVEKMSMVQEDESLTEGEEEDDDVEDE